MQEVNPDARYSEALFLRACKLGVASGCTNRAAGMLVYAAPTTERDTCTARTFQAMCEKHDPWACTMFGQALVAGRGVKRDLQRALSVLPGGCLHGTVDPACTAAKKLEEDIRDALSGKSDPGI